MGLILHSSAVPPPRARYKSRLLSDWKKQLLDGAGERFGGRRCGGCLQDYDLDICTNYKDIIDRAKEPLRGQLKNWFTPFVLIVMGLVYNTKEASKPASTAAAMAAIAAAASAGDRNSGNAKCAGRSRRGGE
jgi:hypothetical protein